MNEGMALVLEKMKKVRLNVPERSDGDGMECLEISNEKKNPLKIVSIAEAHMLKTEHSNKKSGTRRSLKNREAKFIPYEPYKAAITPMIPTDRGERSSKKEAHKPERTLTAKPQICMKQCKCDENVLCLEQEIQTLKQQNAQLEIQLKQQTQVNRDLKKLLVASVGEDMETRVNFLTEDKTKLAHDILHYSQKMMEDSEHMDKISIQCDVWRSKFLASSVMVDELAGWKAVLGHQLNESLEIIKILLDEHENLQIHTYNTFRNLKSLQKAYLTDYTEMEEIEKSSNAMDIAKANDKIVQLLLHKQPSSSETSLPNVGSSLSWTPGEHLAKQMLTASSSLRLPHHSSHSHSEPSEWSYCALTGIYKTKAVPRFHPSTSFEYLTFTGCAHCKGKIVPV